MDTMRELSYVAKQAGFTMGGADNDVTLRRDTWQRHFHADNQLADFLHAAQAGARLDWRDYVTPFDAWRENRDYHQAQYDKALKMAQQGAIIHISVTGGWSAEIPPQHAYQTGYSSVTAYERIGYHACTADLIRGWQDGGAPIIDWRAVYN